MITEKDNGYNAMMVQLEKLSTSSVTVGVHSDVGMAADGETTLLQVATWNEFGTRRIPQRPYIRQTFDKNKKKMDRIMVKLAQKIIKDAKAGGTFKAKDVLDKTGFAFKGMVQLSITNREFAPNAQRTVDEKGSSTPLIDTGLLRSSIDFNTTMRGR